jgi:hypothetical protein
MTIFVNHLRAREAPPARSRPSHRRCGRSRASSWRVGWCGRATRRMTGSSHDHFRKSLFARARGRRCGRSRGSSWRVGWRGRAWRRMTESPRMTIFVNHLRAREAPPARSRPPHRRCGRSRASSWRVGSRGRAQDRGNRRAARHMINVHRRKAALVVMRIPECKLLAAMGGAERVVDVENLEPPRPAAAPVRRAGSGRRRLART